VLSLITIALVLEKVNVPALAETELAIKIAALESNKVLAAMNSCEVFILEFEPTATR
jgi:hypothetical protein